jgi:rhodanese-related sulfurtransferase
MRHLSPTQTWALLQATATVTSATAHLEQPVFIDLRMEIEMLYVGRPPGVEHVPWYEYPELTPNAAVFVATVNHLALGQKDRPVILLCRSGQRSLDAGAALEKAGFTDVINVLHGFEGDLDTHFHRSSVNGWRFDGLPWEQL